MPKEHLPGSFRQLLFTASSLNAAFFVEAPNGVDVIIRSQILSALLVVTFFSVSAAAAEPTFDEIISEVKRAEHSLQNITIRNFSLKYETRSSGSSKWEVTPTTITGDAWFNGLRQSKGRVHIKREVLEWHDGAAPWIEQSIDYGYDGQSGREVRYLSGALGNPHVSHTAIIAPNASDFLQSPLQAIADGRHLSLYFYTDFFDSDRSLSDELSLFQSRGANFRVSNENLFGDDVLLLQAGTESAYDKYWLDERHGYAIRKVEEKATMPTGEVTIRVLEVPELIDAGHGIWYPKRGSRTGPENTDGARSTSRISFEIESAVANDPQFDEGVFTVPIPSGYQVTDAIQNTAYVVTTPDAMAGRIDESVTNVRQGVTQGIDAKNDNGAFTRITLIALMMLAAVVAVVAAITHFRTHRPLVP